MSEFARVESMGVPERGSVEWFKLIAANMVVADGFSEEELLEMAVRLNTAHQKAIAEAVRAEMERCAGIAEKAKGEFSPDGEYGGPWCDACDDIAEEIRRQGG